MYRIIYLDCKLELLPGLYHCTTQALTADLHLGQPWMRIEHQQRYVF